MTITIETLTPDERTYVGHHALRAGKKALSIIDAQAARIAELETEVERLRVVERFTSCGTDAELAEQLAVANALLTSMRPSQLAYASAEWRRRAREYLFGQPELARRESSNK